MTIHAWMVINDASSRALVLVGGMVF